MSNFNKHEHKISVCYLEILCGEPVSVENATSDTYGYHVGDLTNYTCIDGHVMTDQGGRWKTVTCTVEGRWNYPVNLHCYRKLLSLNTCGNRVGGAPCGKVGGSIFKNHYACLVHCPIALVYLYLVRNNIITIPSMPKSHPELIFLPISLVFIYLNLLLLAISCNVIRAIKYGMLSMENFVYGAQVVRSCWMGFEFPDGTDAGASVCSGDGTWAPPVHNCSSK